jgi:hypothetical protein
MEDRYAFSDLIFDKRIIEKVINHKIYNKSEESSVTLIIMGHGRERYKENFNKVIDKYPDYYSEPFIYKVKEQSHHNTVRILSKAGKPKICAWDYSLCTKSMSSQDVILELSHLFFSDDNQHIDTFTLMNSLSIYFKKLYPKMIDKISKNYRDLPEDKNSGSPDAANYSQRYENFNQVLDSLKENKFSELKALNHEKVFTIRPDNEEEYNAHCEKYWFEIVDLRTQESNTLIDFILNRLKLRENLIKNYFAMTKQELRAYIDNYTNTVYTIYSLDTADYAKYYLLKFVFNLYFGNEIMLSEIVEFFEIVGIQTINIIDNTCRVQEKRRTDSSSVKTSIIEADEQIRTTYSRSKKRSSSSSSKTRKHKI